MKKLILLMMVVIGGCEIGPPYGYVGPSHAYVDIEACSYSMPYSPDEAFNCYAGCCEWEWADWTGDYCVETWCCDDYYCTWHLYDAYCY